MTIVQGLIGLPALVALAWLVSENRSRLPWRTVAVGIAIQFVLALVLLKWSAGWQLLLALNGVVEAIQSATRAGTSFVFGYLGGAALPFEEKAPGGAFIFAFQALPLVLLVSALSALLYHWRVLPAVVGAFAWALSRLLRISGAVSFSAAANIFVGMVEAPLLVRPYLAALSRSELFVVMTAGMATIAGTVLVLYATALTSVIANPVGHLLTASLLSAPAAVLIARVMVPGEGETAGGSVAPPRLYESSVDAITRGTLDGLTLLLNIVATLIVIIATGPPCQSRARAAARPCRRADHLGADAGLRFGAHRMADGDSLGRGCYRRIPARNQGGAQRTRRLLLTRRLARGNPERSESTDHDIRALRLCQFREPSVS